MKIVKWLQNVSMSNCPDAKTYRHQGVSAPKLIGAKKSAPKIFALKRLNAARGKKSLRQNVPLRFFLRRNVLWQNFGQQKILWLCNHGEMYLQLSVLAAKNPCGKVSRSEIFLRRKVALKNFRSRAYTSAVKAPS